MTNAQESSLALPADLPEDSPTRVIDTPAAEAGVAELLTALGADPDGGGPA